MLGRRRSSDALAPLASSRMQRCKKRRRVLPPTFDPLRKRWRPPSDEEEDEHIGDGEIDEGPDEPMDEGSDESREQVEVQASSSQESPSTEEARYRREAKLQRRLDDRGRAPTFLAPCPASTSPSVVAPSYPYRSSQGSRGGNRGPAASTPPRRRRPSSRTTLRRNGSGVKSFLGTGTRRRARPLPLPPTRPPPELASASSRRTRPYPSIVAGSSRLPRSHLSFVVV